MEIKANWTSDHDFEWQADGVKILLSPSVPKTHKVHPNPYEIFLFSLAGSTGMEMLRHFRENSTTFTKLSIMVRGKLVDRYHTKVFNALDLIIEAESESDPYKILNAVEVSQYLTGGISAMISKVLPVRWVLIVNKNLIGEGIAKFAEENENPY